MVNFRLRFKPRRQGWKGRVVVVDINHRIVEVLTKICNHPADCDRLVETGYQYGDTCLVHLTNPPNASNSSIQVSSVNSQGRKSPRPRSAAPRAIVVAPKDAVEQRWSFRRRGSGVMSSLCVLKHSRTQEAKKNR